MNTLWQMSQKSTWRPEIQVIRKIVLIWPPIFQDKQKNKRFEKTWNKEIKQLVQINVGESIEELSPTWKSEFNIKIGCNYIIMLYIRAAMLICEIINRTRQRGKEFIFSFLIHLRH